MADLADVPAEVLTWCELRLGSRPVMSIAEPVRQVSAVYGFRLDDGRAVAVKLRVDQNGRARSCVAAQRAVADAGFPCARPLTAVERLGEQAIHAEEWRPGGEMVRRDDEPTARMFAVLFARLMTIVDGLSVEPPLPNPNWVRWDVPSPRLWPPATFLDERDQSLVPPVVDEVARRLQPRLTSSRLPAVLGHADWETQNLRWVEGSTPWAVHDWDSLAWLPEAALVGAASGAFASAETPTLAPVASSAALLDEYQSCRGRTFRAEELEVAWAASLWLAAWNARGQSLFRHPPVALTALEQQADTRLALAGV